jgi:lauroyl/myristoyl acyltransferase
MHDDLAIKVVYALIWPILLLFRNQRMINLRRLLLPAGRTEQQCNEISKKYVWHHANLILEAARLSSITPEQIRQRVIFEGEQNLVEALKKGRGVLLIGNHVGGWLHSLTFLSSCGYRLSAVAYEIPIRSIESHMKSLWRKHNLAITNVGRGATEAALQAFGRNEIFVVYQDVSLRPTRGVWLRLGSTAINVDIGPAKLAFMSDAPILRLSNHRQSDSRFVVSISPEIERAGNPVSLAQIWLDEFHKELLSWPEQWWLLTLISLRIPSSVSLSPTGESVQLSNTRVP